MSQVVCLLYFLYVFCSGQKNGIYVCISITTYMFTKKKEKIYNTNKHIYKIVGSSSEKLIIIFKNLKPSSDNVFEIFTINKIFQILVIHEELPNY